MGKLEEMAYESPSTPDVAAKLKSLSILMKHKDKNFVKRALNPKDSPVYDDGKGFRGSHYMSSSTLDDGREIVYPSIVQKPGRLGLEKLSGKDAVKYAIDSDEFIEFDNQKDAAWFGINYKNIWKQDQ